jgi:alpha-mannosidase
LIAVKAQKHAGRLPQRASLFTVSAENAVVSAVRATSEGIVVRVYEAEGKAISGISLSARAAILSACETNLIEKEATPLPLSESGTVRFDLAPFEIKTLRLTMQTL